MIEEIKILEEDTIEELIHESENEGYRFLSKMFSQWNSRENQFQKENEKAIIFRENNKVIAIGGINEEPYLKRKDFGRLRGVYVLPSFRRKHVGKEIVKHLIDFGNKYYKAITLRVPDNIEAYPFYESIGFEMTNEYESVTHIKWIKKALGIIGSPRHNGSTALLISRVLEGLKNTGYEINEIHVDELNLKYCTGCKSCDKTRECNIDDNFTKLKKEFWQSNIIVIGSPSYWGDVTGHIKVLFDRFTPYCDTIDGKTIVPSGKRGIAIAIRAGSTRNENQHILDSINHFYSHLGIKNIGNICVESINDISDLISQEEMLTKAYFLGANIDEEDRQEHPVLALKTGG
ncbi:MAG: GNAT family N-acetyltransferase [Candidatus Lokiarchaeota archaeon]|nr:GNAT family N-acetyltransferase [Candidatus Lokiarchaeota archaeon]